MDRPTADEFLGGAKSNGLGNELLTEDSGALEFLKLYRDKLRFDRDKGAWFEWTDSVWRENRTGLAFHWARELARALAITEPDRVRYVASKTGFAGGVERFARCDPAFAVTSETWDRDPFLLGTPGGTVDLRTGALRPGRPGDGITKSAAVAPSDAADCPLWLRFLAEATNGDEGMARFLQQWGGYCLTGDVSEQCLVFVWGPGGNGKGVAVNVISGVIGDYAATAAMETFTASRGERHSTDLAMLRGARLVTASETEHGRAWAENRIKNLTGSDPITARFLNQNNFTFRPVLKLTIIGNHTPRLHNVDDAMRRRINIVPFVHNPPARDLDLEEKLKAEWPAILRWMIDGCLDWQKNRLVRPGSVMAATGKYFAEQDLFGQWLDEECDVDPGNRWKMAASGDLFASWTNYAKAAGGNAGNRAEFAAELEKQGFIPDKGTKGRRIWRGVCLKPEPSETEERF
jgi:putative DNA primase/helicase